MYLRNYVRFRVRSKFNLGLEFELVFIQILGFSLKFMTLCNFYIFGGPFCKRSKIKKVRVSQWDRFKPF